MRHALRALCEKGGKPRRYGLCGLEYVPAQILSLIGIIGCVIAGLILLPVALITISDRFLSEKSEAGENAPPTD